MENLKRILVATDFSEQSQFAISRAVDIAKTAKAQLLILHVVQKGFFDKVIDEVLPAARVILITPKEYAEQLLEEQINKLAPHKLKIEKIILSGEHPAKKILNYTKNNKIDLLVMGAHGEYSIHDWFVGTTTEYIAEKTTCPVLIIKNKPRHDYRKILIPVDFSLASKNAVEFSTQLLPKKDLRILHVGDQAYEDLLENDDDIPPGKSNKLRKEIFLILKNKTEKFINGCHNTFIKLSYDIKLGYPGIVILNEAKRLKRDLVIMGTEGHSRFHYLWLGRVASRVLIETEKDILLVPPASKKFKHKKISREKV